MNFKNIQIISILLSCIISLILGVIFIPMLRRLKFGQSIRDIGPAWHGSKAGTPTMGGIIFIGSVTVTALAVYFLGDTFGLSLDIDNRFFSVLLVSIAFGVIGFLDDFIKVALKRNLGLTVIQKFGLQFVVALLYIAWEVNFNELPSSITLPFGFSEWDLGGLFIPFSIFVILGTVNAVNFTDGLDGLATSVTIVVSMFFAMAAAAMQASSVVIIASALIGGLFGFLFYNKFPAKVFMGDTGSLFLGGMAASMAITLRMPLVILIIGIVYVVEILSVIIQVTSFKLTKKRVFKMSPIHHHFEMCGWSEKKVVMVFTVVTLAICAIAYSLGGF